MKKVWVVLLLTALLAGVAIARQRHHPESAFDYYLLNLSWAPAYCASGSAASSECDPTHHFGFVVHGLWPEGNNGGYPQNCGAASPVSQPIVQHMLTIMPSSSLIQHEWAKHGTCSGLSTQEYFAAIEKLYTGLRVPREFQQPSSAAQTSPPEVEAKFASANSAPKDAFRVSCPQNEFSAVEVCVSKAMQYQACPDTAKECRARQIEVRPVR